MMPEEIFQHVPPASLVLPIISKSQLSHSPASHFPVCKIVSICNANLSGNVPAVFDTFRREAPQSTRSASSPTTLLIPSS
jgi:hypothetical protein